MSPDDSLRTSRMPSILRSFTSSAIFWPITSTDVWYGDLGDDDARRPFLLSSISATARILIEPRPVRYASRIPLRPRISPPVGKSGPFTNCMRSSDVASGLSIRCSVASIDLAEVVRRDVGGHADRDAAAAVDEQVREPRREHRRLARAAVVGGVEVDGVLVDLAEQLHRERRQPRLGVVVDEAAGEEGVVVGVDPDGVHGLHAGVGDGLDGGVVPTAGNQRRDDLLDLVRTDTAHDRVAAALPVARPGRCCASRATSCRHRVPRSRRARTRRGTGSRSVALLDGCAGSSSRIALAASAASCPRTRRCAAKRRASRRLPMTSLISPLCVARLPRDDAELEEQRLHVARELLAAGGVRDLDRVLAEGRHASVAFEQRLEERLLDVGARVSTRTPARASPRS